MRYIEYKVRIENIVPDSAPNLGTLTNMYENVRYGGENASEDKKTHANNLWQNLKGMLRKLRGG